MFLQDGPSPSVVEKASSDGHVTWLNQRKVKAFYSGVVAPELRSGVNMLLQVRITPHQCHQLIFVGVCLTKPVNIGINSGFSKKYSLRLRSVQLSL